MTTTTDTTASMDAPPVRVPATDADLDAVQIPLTVADIAVAEAAVVPTGALIALTNRYSTGSAAIVLDACGYVASVVHADRGLLLVAGMPTSPAPATGDDVQGDEPDPGPEPAPAGAPASASDDTEESW
jgi:pyruvate/2-oxoglutarate dehydrogenase complex dihydrolipoamide acyltransferase (E2) component